MMGAFFRPRMHSMWFKVSAILFCWSWTGLVMYLFVFDSNYLVFWTLLMAVIGAFGFQIVLLSGPSQTKLLYAETFAIFIGLQLLPIAYVGSSNVYETDAYYELRATLDIMSRGWNPNLSLLGSVSAYPAVHIFTAQLSSLLGVQVFDVARWMGLLGHTVAFVFFLLFAGALFRNPRVVLLSALPVAFMFSFVMGSSFTRTSFSVGLFFLTLFLVARNYPATNIRWTLLTFVSTTATLFAHSLAPV